MSIRALYQEFRSATATFSPCRTYRYTLTRTWSEQAPTVCWILLNPSTADEHKLDPTLRRCLGFSRDWGFGSMVVVNLFAFRSPYPPHVYAADDPIGPENDRHIRRMAKKANKVIVGWGVHGTLLSRGESVATLVAQCKVQAWCLGTTKASHPKHPLYVAAATELVKYGI
ncbi:MAG TPA: DUF1643 domain-containing protein [Gemmataceae bacterium]|jgi:hypothetical protein|nr:DUF1643 domain-containing protein [Gemmataceae bacterium]